MKHKYISRFSIQISEYSDSLTQMEKSMVQYLIKHKHEFMPDNFTIAHVAQQLNVSTTSLHRLSKKLGYESFTLFKNDYFLDGDVEYNQLSSHDYLTMITNTYQLVDDCIQDSMLEAMLNANKMTIYGMGMSRYIGEMFQIKLRLLGIPSEQYDDSRFMRLSSQILEPQKDVIIILSRSGMTPELIEVLMETNQRHVESILITEAKGTPLESLATYVIYTSYVLDDDKNVDTRLNAHIAMDIVMDRFLKYKQEKENK